MDLLLILSQEHDKLPLAELRAVLEAEEVETELELVCPGLVILRKLDDEHFDEYYRMLVRRLGYAHEVHQLLTTVDYEDLEDEILSIDWSEYIDENFAVRVKRFRSDIDTVGTEKRAGHLILTNTPGISVNLSEPKSLIRIVAYLDNVYLCYGKYRLDKKYFEDMKPHKRPFFHPGCMSPKLARCMVNLSRIKEGQTVLDPFCGTGGILIEAGLVGAKVIGCDIDWRMKKGTATNLEYVGITDYKTHVVDIRELEMYEEVDAVVTDPPYGISTTTCGEGASGIFKEFLESIEHSMKEDALLVMASPDSLDIDSLFKEVGFVLLERYSIKMHKSLTRIISVIAKI
ncbi:TIGR01177 family methyltransferase [uncultured Methanobrevibacter sp.]|uniref:TIGR01177 family methyltransferase n=1 Tax=uncultured Methanobrevibacter sp. TaxID=253161 RepID=UPI002601856E